MITRDKQVHYFSACAVVNAVLLKQTQFHEKCNFPFISVRTYLISSFDGYTVIDQMSHRYFRCLTGTFSSTIVYWKLLSIAVQNVLFCELTLGRFRCSFVVILNSKSLFLTTELTAIVLCQHTNMHTPNTCLYLITACNVRGL